ncbi:MAG: PAS and helix-turn-helix domain-containing protein [Fimbriimonadaceae bacterium]|nr:PAS and helix-turn-helix domain-containing protein [Alphaproteobacteria bacterium]
MVKLDPQILMDAELLSIKAFEHAPVGLIVSENRIIRRCNAAFAAIFGYRMEELENRSLSQLYPSHDEFQRIGEIGHKIMLREGKYLDERIMMRKDGSHFWCRVRGQSLTPENPFSLAVWSFADFSDQRPISDLTRRERQLAMLLSRGKTNKEIAKDLVISPRTAEAHRARLMHKLGVKNTAELMARISGIPL